MRQFITFFMLLLCAITAQSQIDSLQRLPEVLLSDAKLYDNHTGIKVLKITDSTLQRSRTSLTDVLRANALIYLRENGPGGVSSPSLRGTNAQQTAVVWNGININSQLTGQTDFNTISTGNYDNVSVRVGGGSTLYGSGAVGGSIHLENDIRFGKTFENQVSIGYGSFNTQIASAKTTVAREHLYINGGLDFQSSDNDFEYLGTDQRNENGAYENVNLNLNIGYKLSNSGAATNTLKVYHNSFLGDRNFSGTLTAPSNDAYEDRNTRTLVSWEQRGAGYNGTLRLAHVFEQFKYFGNNENLDQYSIGKANRFVGNYDAVIKFDNSKHLTLSGELNTITADGSSIQKDSRIIASAVALWKHKLTNAFNYEVQLRQEVVEERRSPLLLGVGMEYAFAKANNQSRYVISLNASRNYRIPTFNDLFWEGAGATGNPDVKPETSLQAELGHAITLKNIKLGVTTFYIETEDLIKWQPDNSGIWSPVNIAETQHYGLEISADYTKTFGQHHLATQAQYGYTVAEDVATGNQLIYVPKNKIIFSLAHRYRWLSSFVQSVANDDVFTKTDNTAVVDGYVVANAGITAHLFSKKTNGMAITARLNNIFNTSYETVAFRPNPGRNFLIQTTYNF